MFVCVQLCAVSVGCTTLPDSGQAVPGIVVVQSDDSPAFAAVTNEITKKWKQEIEVYKLKDGLDLNGEIQQKVQYSNKQIVVAVGLPAALITRKLSGKKVVFCQVFNYEDYDLITSRMKGVSAIPPVAQQFQAWKKLDPSLTRVGVITGKNLRGLLQEAFAAAKDNQITLSHIEVGSDLEMLYAFKRLSPSVQALWLIPDNRVLSRKVLIDLLSAAYRQGKQVLVFGPQLLPLGGIMSVESDYADIANQVWARVRSAAAEDTPTISGVGILPLTKLKIKINAALIKRFGLTLPQEFREAIHAS
jgi:ABC-type uncharacterized transport system substrate-binding protein